MKVTSPELKALIYGLIAFENELKEDGSKVQRVTYPKQFLRGVREVKEKIAGGVEVCVGPAGKKREEVTMDEVKWMDPKAYTRDQGQLLGERHTQAELEFSSRAVEAIKHYYEEAEEIPEVTTQALDELEAGLGIKAA